MHRLGAGASAATPPGTLHCISESTIMQSEFTKDNVSILMNHLCDVWQKWKYIGDEFSISDGRLEQIKEDNYTCKDRMRAVIIERLKQGGPISSFELGYILSNPTIGADTLANKFCPRFPQPREHKITKENVLHCIKPDISDTVFPYTYMKKPGSIVYLISCIFWVYVVMQMATVFGDGAFQSWKYTNDQFPNRVVFLLLHAILMIVFPGACYVQLGWLYSLENTYLKQEKQINISEELKLEMENILTKRKISLSPLDFIEQISFLRICNLKEVDFNCFQVPMHAIVYPCLLYWLGVFSDVPPSTSWIYMEYWDCFAVGIGLVLTGIVKDIYCIENHVATILVENDYDQNNRSEDIFRAIRHRWRVWDTFIHIIVVVFLVLFSVFYYFGVPFGIAKSKETPADDFQLNTWNILTFIIVIMQASGSSANATFKKIGMIGYILLPLFMCVSAYTQGIVSFDQIRNGFYFYNATGHIYLILSTTQLVTVLNWLLCLQRCYWLQLDKQYHSLKYHGLCIASLVVVIVGLLVVPIVEFKHLFYLMSNITNGTNTTDSVKQP